MTPYDELLDDLAAEHRALDAVLARMTDAQWDLPSHAPGWLARDQVAHLAHFDEAAALAIADAEAFRADAAATRAERGPRRVREAIPRPGARDDARRAARVVARGRREARGRGAHRRRRRRGCRGTARRWARSRSSRRGSWRRGRTGSTSSTSSASRVPTRTGCGTWSSSGSGRARSPTSRAASRRIRRPCTSSCTSPSGATWTHGEPGSDNRITGSARDFCRVVTQRRHVADTDLRITGPAAEEWMRFAQAFAGPPGEGRRPGQFPKEEA